MIRIGIIGEIGSGKSYVAKNFGYPVFNADYEVSQLYIKNKKMFIQVNTGNEETKSGVSSDTLAEFVKYCRYDLNLNIVGLMCIPPINDIPKNHFEALRQLANKNNLKELSIGMSNDYMEALSFNPRYIRLGTLLFGNRK